MAPKKLTNAQMQEKIAEQAAAMEEMQQMMVNLQTEKRDDEDKDLNMESSDDETSEDGDGVRVKMEPPKAKWDGENRD